MFENGMTGEVRFCRRERLWDIRYQHLVFETEWERWSVAAGARGGARYERYLGSGVAVEGELGLLGPCMGLAWYPWEDSHFTVALDLWGLHFGWRSAVWAPR
jgi:hypothetical protein